MKRPETFLGGELEWDELSEPTRMLLAEALDQHPGFTLPDPLRKCGRCPHAAFYGPDHNDSYYCGNCAGDYSIFIIRTPPTDIRQRAADAALADKEGRTA